MVITWLKKSDMRVNESKTECCVFYKTDVAQRRIKINQEYVATKSIINMLGIVFDSKLQWAPQVAGSISKATRALNGLRLINRYFNMSKLLSLVTSNYYSTLYYSSEVWMLNMLNQNLRTT